METEYLKMKCQSCGSEKWAEADIVAELATYQQNTKTYAILYECPECNGTMK